MARLSACFSGSQCLGFSWPHFYLSIFPQTREKEKMKEAKDARYTNGHLFTTISVSGMTMCYACNKSITAKEALICPSKLLVPTGHSDWVVINPSPFHPGSLKGTLLSEPHLGSSPMSRCLVPLLLPFLTLGVGCWNVAWSSLLGMGWQSLGFLSFQLSLSGYPPCPLNSC